MKKQYIKMNNNDNILSLGNLFRVIKEMAQNKIAALQVELFCTIFEGVLINETTVNNYCVGCRSIGDDYKQVFLNKQKRYSSDKTIFFDIVINLLSIIDGKVYLIDKNKLSFINSNESMVLLCKKMYNIAKNDKKVKIEYINKLNDYLKNENYYEFLVEIFFYVVLVNKQPLYEEDLKKSTIESILDDTCMSYSDLQDYLLLKLREGINFDYSMKKIAMEGNAYANFELGTNEYYGYVTGTPRYDRAFEYLKKAALVGHAGANYMIANLYLRGLIGSKSDDELMIGYEYLKKSYELGNVAASNLLGNMYYEGIYPLEKNVDVALKYYKKASLSNYVFAFNNLGKIEEKKGNRQEAFNYFKEAALLGESWACNKVGEYYRLGYIEKNMENAYLYYNKAIDTNHRTLCYYAYYNLGKYFYMNGFDNIRKDEKKALDYLVLASNNGVLEASIELFYYYVTKYLETYKKEDYLELLKYKMVVEEHKNYNDEICLAIENKLASIRDKKRIDISFLDEVEK